VLFHYRAADGVWRDRCRQHIKTVGPYRAVTAPVPSNTKICVECRPWGGWQVYQPPQYLTPEPQPPKPEPVTVSAEAERSALWKIWQRFSSKWFMPATAIKDAMGRRWIWQNIGRYFQRHPDAWHLVSLAPNVARLINQAHVVAGLYQSNDGSAIQRIWNQVLTR
jgi:hypothetical protein